MKKFKPLIIFYCVAFIYIWLIIAFLLLQEDFFSAGLVYVFLIFAAHSFKGIWKSIHLIEKMNYLFPVNTLNSTDTECMADDFRRAVDELVKANKILKK
jgi:hypothetical protein